MRSYIALIDDEGGKGFGVVFPDLPGCVTEGDTLDEAVDRAREALSLYAAEAAARGYGMAEPRPIEALRADPEFRRSLKNALLVAVPLAAGLGERERVNVMLDKILLSEIDAAAAKTGTTRSGFLEIAARDRIVRNREAGKVKTAARPKPVNTVRRRSLNRLEQTRPRGAKRRVT